MMFRDYLYTMYRFLFLLHLSSNDIYCIIEEPYKHYFTEKVSLSKIGISQNGWFNTKLIDCSNLNWLGRYSV